MSPGGWEPGTEDKSDSKSEGEEELSVGAGSRKAKSPQKKTRVTRHDLGWNRVWEGRSYEKNTGKNGDGSDVLTEAAPSEGRGRGVDGLGRPRTGSYGWMPFGPLRGGGWDACIWRVGLF